MGSHARWHSQASRSTHPSRVSRNPVNKHRRRPRRRWPTSVRSRCRAAGRASCCASSTVGYRNTRFSAKGPAAFRSSCSTPSKPPPYRPTFRRRRRVAATSSAARLRTAGVRWWPTLSCKGPHRSKFSRARDRRLTSTFYPAARPPFLSVRRRRRRQSRAASFMKSFA